MCKKRVRGKGRKTKKQRENLYRCGNGEKVLFSYSKKRKMDRKSHVSSIACARKAGKNYWDMWGRVTRTVQESERILRICEYSILRKTH